MFQKVVAPKDWKLMEMSKTRSRNKLKSISNPSHTTKLLTVARHKVHWRSALVLSPHILWKSGLTSKEDHIKVTCTDICHKKVFQYDVHSPLNNRTCFIFTGHHQASLRGPLVLYRGQVWKALYSEIQCIMGTTVDRQTDTHLSKHYLPATSRWRAVKILLMTARSVDHLTELEVRYSASLNTHTITHSLHPSTPWQSFL